MSGKMLKKQVIRIILLVTVYKFLKGILTWLKQKKFLQAQSHIAPFALEFGSTPLSMMINFGRSAPRAHDYRLELLKKYTGKLNGVDTVTGCGILFPWSPLVLTGDDRIVKHVLKDNFNNYLRIDLGFKTVFGKSLLTVNHGPLAEDGGRFFRHQRKTSTKLFTNRNLNGLVGSSVLSRTKKVMDELHKHINSKSIGGFKMKDQIYAYSFAIICEVGFGYKFTSYDEELRYQRDIDTIARLIPQHVVNPLWRLPFHEKYLKSKQRLIAARDDVSLLCFEMIDARLAESEEKKLARGDLLSLVMSSSQPVQYSRDELKDFILLFLAAGGDTAANIIHWVIFHLAMEPELQEELFRQTRVYFHRKDDSSDYTIDVLAARKNMYLDGVVMEALRMHPPLSLNGKKAAQDDTLPNGLVIKKGTTVMFDAYAMGRDAVRYPDPDKFLPTRWADTSRKAEFLNEYALPVFLGGKRICLGRSLALHEIKVFIVALVNEFTFKLHEEELEANIAREVLYSDGFIHGYANELLVTAFKRVVSKKA